ncbi:Plectin/S10 domain-containing protein, partial [Boletus coccyginus]
PKKNRRIIYENLFKDIDVPNLDVIKAMQSLTSKGLVKTQFSWQWYYYVLTPEGVEYLREWLDLPSEIVPATHQRAARPARQAAVHPGAGEGGGARPPGRLPEEGGWRTWRLPAILCWLFDDIVNRSLACSTCI